MTKRKVLPRKGQLIHTFPRSTHFLGCGLEQHQPGPIQRPLSAWKQYVAVLSPRTTQAGTLNTLLAFASYNPGAVSPRTLPQHRAVCHWQLCALHRETHAIFRDKFAGGMRRYGG